MNLKNFRKFIEDYDLRSKKLLISVSGGVDSMVMLDLLAKELPVDNLRVITFNHNTRKECSAEVDLVCKRSLELGLSFDCESLHLDVNNFEEKARILRLGKYREYMQKFKLDGVVLGHHADDSLETFFYNLIKGSFLKGLTGIAEYNSNLEIYRPLISYTKLEIREYADLHKIKYLDDESNFSVKYARNFLRLKVLPLLKARFKNFQKQLLIKMQLFSELEVYVSSQAEIFIRDNVSLGEFGRTLPKKAFLVLPSFLQFEVLTRLGIKFTSYANFLDYRKKISSAGVVEKFDAIFTYIAADHILLTDLSLELIGDRYFRSFALNDYTKVRDSSVLNYKGKSFLKSKELKTLAFYLRGGVPVQVDKNQVLSFRIKKS